MKKTKSQHAANKKHNATHQHDAMRPLAGRTAIITGSGRNIGRGIALMFARAGANIVVNGHKDKKALDSVVAEIEVIGGKALAVLADIADHKQIDKMVKAAEKRFGAVDIAVSNASVRREQPLLEMSLADWDGTLKTNLYSAFYLARAVLPGMCKRRWGRIIHLSGEDGFTGQHNRRAHVAVAKAGIHAFSRAITIEFGPYGITGNTVSPGSVDTERDWSHYAQGYEQKRVKPIPLGKVASIDDIAGACLYLAGPSGSHIAGQVIHVNGGRYMY